MIKLKYKVTKKDIVDTTVQYELQSEEYKKKSKMVNKLMFIAALIGDTIWIGDIIIKFNNLSYDEIEKRILFILVYTILIIGVMFFSNKNAAMNMEKEVERNMKDNNNSYQESIISLTVDNDLFMIEAEKGSALKYNLNTLKKLVKAKECFGLMYDGVLNNELIIIPYNAFKDESEKKYFECILSKYIK